MPNKTTNQWVTNGRGFEFGHWKTHILVAWNRADSSPSSSPWTLGRLWFSKIRAQNICQWQHQIPPNKPSIQELLTPTSYNNQPVQQHHPVEATPTLADPEEHRRLKNTQPDPKGRSNWSVESDWRIRTRDPRVQTSMASLDGVQDQAGLRNDPRNDSCPSHSTNAGKSPNSIKVSICLMAQLIYKCKDLFHCHVWLPEGKHG